MQSHHHHQEGQNPYQQLELAIITASDPRFPARARQAQQICDAFRNRNDVTLVRRRRKDGNEITRSYSHKFISIFCVHT